jgi:hypothetical protein
MGGGKGSYLPNLKVGKEYLQMSFHLYLPIIKQSITYSAVNLFHNWCFFVVSPVLLLFCLVVWRLNHLSK